MAKGSFASGLATYVLLLAFVLVFAWFAITVPNITDTANIANVLKVSSISLVMLLSVTWIFAIGEIDVSFVNVAALANVITAWSVQSGSGWAYAAFLAISAGIAVGTLNGVLVGYLRLPSIITTIATGGLALSFAELIARGASFGIGGTGAVGRALAMKFGIIPVLFPVAAAFCIIAFFAQERLSIGRYIYAQGANYKAVHQAGINVRRMNVLLFVFASFTAAVAGFLIAIDLGSGQPGIGSSYLIDGLTAIFLGGMVFRRGEPNVLGTFVGVIFLAMLTSGAALSGWANYQADIAKGFFLLLGIAFVISSQRMSELHDH